MRHWLPIVSGIALISAAGLIVAQDQEQGPNRDSGATVARPKKPADDTSAPMAPDSDQPKIPSQYKRNPTVPGDIATFKSDVDTSQWHTFKVEIVGDEMLVSIDDKPTAYLKSPGVDHATKNAIGFEVAGKEVSIKDVKVWEATANPDWAAKRDAVVGALVK